MKRHGLLLSRSTPRTDSGERSNTLGPWKPDMRITISTPAGPMPTPSACILLCASSDTASPWFVLGCCREFALAGIAQNASTQQPFATLPLVTGRNFFGSRMVGAVKGSLSSRRAASVFWVGIATVLVPSAKSGFCLTARSAWSLAERHHRYRRRKCDHSS